MLRFGQTVVVRDVEIRGLTGFPLVIARSRLVSHYPHYWSVFTARPTDYSNKVAAQVSTVFLSINLYCSPSDIAGRTAEPVREEESGSLQTGGHKVYCLL